ncbi:MAG: rod shape-determining protein MreD [Candidatus Omnitrophica bacterium]|nr:rod shape-determining protein MreD [Candidatus Omnitrophota bacterium]
MRKIKRYHAYAVIILTFIAQLVVSNYIDSAMLRPNLMIILLTFLALFSDKWFGLEVGIIVGLFFDIVSIRPFGINILLYGAGGFLIGAYNNKFYRNSRITSAILVFLASCFILSLYYISVTFVVSSMQSLAHFKPVLGPLVIIPSAVNSLFAVFLFTFLFKIFRYGEDVM